MRPSWPRSSRLPVRHDSLATPAIAASTAWPRPRTTAALCGRHNGWLLRGSSTQLLARNLQAPSCRGVALGRQRGRRLEGGVMSKGMTGADVAAI